MEAPIRTGTPRLVRPTSRWVQNVSLARVSRNWWTIVWPDSGTGACARVASWPAAQTSDRSRVGVSFTPGAPLEPAAAAPALPTRQAPLNEATVIDPW